MEKAIKRKSTKGRKFGERVAPRKCEYCSTISKRVFVYKEVNVCDKHYWHLKKHGKILWGEKRPYKTPVERREKHTESFGIAWRKAVFERDNYTCQICKVRGKQIQADHIKPFKYFPELRWILSNGRTLCVPCHRKTDTYGRRGQKLYEKSN